LYVGLNGGYGWGDQDWSITNGPLIGSGRLRGGLFGGQVGYNWQVNDRFVLGVQADGDWADITGLATNSLFLDGRCSGGISDQSADCRTKVKALATLTGRLGYLPWENTLVYAKAGVAWASIDFTVNNVIDITGGTCGPVGTNQGGYNTNHHTRTAFTAGAGVEQRVWDRVSVFGEYDYVDLRGTTTDLNSGGTGFGTCTANFTSTTNYKADNIFRLGVNVKLW
jgi:outer membrane immunogenic protein